jgi:DNA-directed RNA polymerase specialized sigma24 family protein
MEPAKDSMATTTPTSYESFVSEHRVALRQAMVARFGVDVGCEATADAMAYAFEHWARVSIMTNPLGYLYRVGQTSARKQFRWSKPIALPPPDAQRLPDVEPGLPKALVGLSDERRVIVLLVHSHDWSYAQVADFLNIDIAKVRNELHRGLQQLRNDLGGAPS